MKSLLHSRFFFSSAINHREDRPPTVRVLSCLRSFDHTAHGSIGDLGLCPNVQERLSADHLESVPEAVATGSPCEMPETASRLLRKKDIHEFTRNKARRRSSICPISCDFVDCSTPAYRGRNSFFSGPATGDPVATAPGTDLVLKGGIWSIYCGLPLPRVRSSSRERKSSSRGAKSSACGSKS
jgi:hypothetical protein